MQLFVYCPALFSNSTNILIFLELNRNLFPIITLALYSDIYKSFYKCIDNLRHLSKFCVYESGNWNQTPRSDACKEVGLEVNTEKTKYMLLSRHQTVGQNHDIKIGNRFFKMC
jgi:hypothetical protein